MKEWNGGCHDLGESGEMVVKGYKVSVKRWVSSEAPLFSMITMVNDTVLHMKFAKRVDLCSHHTHTQKVTMWGDGYIN